MRTFDVLVVDDTDDKRSVIVHCLRAQGYLVREASSASAALAHFEEHAPDLLVTDVQMPGMSGFDLIEHIMQNPNWTDVPVLIQTNHATDHEDMRRAAELGALSYVTNPLQLDLLVAHARLLLRLKGRMDFLIEQASTDPLTGISNRRLFSSRLEREYLRCQRTGRPFCLVAIDVDHFKRVNDTFGHQRGDDVLRLIGDLLSQHIRGMDTAARYGGEEFMLILAETGSQGGAETAERLRRAIMTECESLGVGTISASFGVAEYPRDVEGAKNPLSALVTAADQALYASKQGGRNRVSLAADLVSH
jgi:diguanylate cyclase (GGDEF)-like protein